MTGAIEKVCRDMERAVGGGMMWIDYSECVEFVRRLREIAASGIEAREGEKPQALSAKHESPTAEGGDAQQPPQSTRADVPVREAGVANNAPATDQ